VLFSVTVLLAVFWGGREGFQTLLNTKVHAELSHMASFFRMAVSKLLLLLLRSSLF